eukprot:Sspe_Gene.11609::Locus_3943_Transcript_1_1_Confidence_1.000_Length_3096::g.11609::m.11609
MRGRGEGDGRRVHSAPPRSVRPAGGGSALPSKTAAPKAVGPQQKCYFCVVVPPTGDTPPPAPLALKLTDTLPLGRLFSRIPAALGRDIPYRVFWKGQRVSESATPRELAMPPGRENLHILQVVLPPSPPEPYDATLQQQLKDALALLDALRARVDAHSLAAAQLEG